MIRVGFDARYISTAATGLGNYSLSLMKALVQEESKFEFCLFTPDRESLNIFEPLDNVRIYEVPRTPWFGRGRAGAISYEQLALPSAMLREQLDLIHFAYYLEPALSRSPFIITILDMDTFLPSHRHSPWTRAYQNNLIRLQARRSAAVLTISEYSKKQIVDFLGIPPEKVYVVYCGLGAVFSGTPGQLQPEGSSDADSHGEYMLYAGGLGMRKNLLRMVDAFALARRACGSGARLVITGEIAEVGQALKRYTDDAGYSSFIRFTGHVPDEQLPVLYGNAIASIYPSLNEGFGLPVIESMASGVPVITSRDSAMAEIAGGRAILVDPLDRMDIAAAIGALLLDRDLASAYGARGPEQASGFSWTLAARQCLELYQEVLSRERKYC